MPVDIGKSIRVIRQAKGFPLKDVAAAASISNPFLTLVEKGARQPSLDVIRRSRPSVGSTSRSVDLDLAANRFDVEVHQ